MKHAVALAAVALVACGGKAKPVDTTALTLQGSATEAAPAPAGEDPAAVTPAPADATEAPADPAFEAKMGQAVAMFQAMGAAAEAAAGDCGKAAVGLSAVMDEHRSLLLEINAWSTDPAVKTKTEAWMKAHMDELMEPMMKVGVLGQECGHDPAFAAVMARFDDGPAD